MAMNISHNYNKIWVKDNIHTEVLSLGVDVKEFFIKLFCQII